MRGRCSGASACAASIERKTLYSVGLVERSMELDLRLQWGVHDQA
jgi:hypothetical protein